MKNCIRKIFTAIFFVSLALVGSKDRVWSQDLVRIATFNTSLNLCANNRTSPCLEGGLNQYLANGNYAPAQGVAEILQRIAPDIVLLNEFNFDPSGAAADLFQQNFLSVGQNVSRHPDGSADPISYPYRYLAAVNTGVHSGWDLDNNGSVDDSVGDGSYAGDAFGFGEFPGRYGMLLLSKYPIDVDAVRTFQNFLWKDMPDSLLPTSWYSESEQDVLRLSSKSHWDVPIDVNGPTLHVLASHPTPPVFDGRKIAMVEGTMTKFVFGRTT
ncbi:MAG: endonuclease/exonuclease/phosphatase family protein [Pirellulaceae bacterium]